MDRIINDYETKRDLFDIALDLLSYAVALEPNAYDYETIDDAILVARWKLIDNHPGNRSAYRQLKDG